MGDRAGLLLFSQVAHTARRPPRKVRPLEVHRSQRGESWLGLVLSRLLCGLEGPPTGTNGGGRCDVPGEGDIGKRSRSIVSRSRSTSAALSSSVRSGVIAEL